MIRKQDRLSINLSQTAAHCKANPPCVNAGFGIYYISMEKSACGQEDLTTLLRLEGEEAPDALCVTFDVHAPTFRHQASEAYKATRKPMPEELRVQVPVLKEVLDALNIPRYEQEGWEADDLIGTISRKCEADGWDCVVVTGDKDSLQLITDHTMVKLVSTRMGQTTTKDMTETASKSSTASPPST